MGIKRVVWGSLFAFTLSAGSVAFADTISGSAGAGFRAWSAADLNQNGHPYWDNTSTDGNKKNVGYFLVNAPTAHLTGAPGPMPYWGYSYNSANDTGGTADLNVFFQRDEQFSTADLKLEVAGDAEVNEFGWYDINQPSVLHPLFGGPDSPPETVTFAPSADYGFYLKDGTSGTFFTQSSLNPKGDTSHQHFAIFEQSAVSGAEVYWLGIEDQTTSELNKAEGGYGDFNDMLIRISAIVPQTESVPEPSAGLLAFLGTALVIGVIRRRRD